MAKIYDITPERKTTLMCEPHLMAFLHIMKHEWADEAREGRGVIACTDGDTIWYGQRYADMEPSERCYVHVHELSHGIYMHPDRAVLLRLMRGVINPALFNYAGDALINEGIEANRAMPPGLFTPPKAFPPIKMEFIHARMKEAIDFSKAKPPSNYDPKALKGLQVETIYDWLMWALNAVKNKRRENEEKCPRAQQRKQEREEAGKTGDKGDREKPDEEKGDRPGDDGQDGDQPGGKEGDGGRPGDGDRCDPGGKPSNKPCTCGQCDQDGKGQGKGQGRGKGSGEGSGDDGHGDGKGAGGETALDGAQGVGDDGLLPIERMARERAWDIEEQLERMKELLDEGKTTNELIDGINDRITTARNRINQVTQGLKQQGTGQGSILLELEADLPNAVVPWDRHLRRMTTKNLGTKMDDSYVRYGSNTMTALARGARVVPFSPGTTIFTQRPKVLVIMDVSGSHIGKLPHCFAEIDSIARKKGAEIEVMTFDHGVQEIIQIRNKADFRTIMERGIRGGGGTVLDNVWAQVARMRDPYKMAIVMTDGYLDAGKEPKIPVIWMVTPGGSTEFATYGETIYLPDHMADAA